MEHGSQEGHQWTLHDEVVRVPLIIKYPGGRDAGRGLDGRSQEQLRSLGYVD